MGLDISREIENLKSSLAEALELYPPVAGRVQTNENGELCITMKDLETGDSVGTPFIVETSSTPFIADSQSLSPRTDIFLSPQSSNLSVKVTLFPCGIWAKISRHEPLDLATVPDDWSHTPSRFFANLAIKDRNNESPSPFYVVEEPPVQLPQFMMVPSDVSWWKIDSKSMAKLKHDLMSCMTGADEGQWISSGDAVVSLLSGSMTRARANGNVPRLGGRSSEESDSEHLAMAADARRRVPKENNSNVSYFGNFNSLWGSTVSRQDLLQPTLEASARVALTIRQDLNIHLSPQHIANKLSFLESLPGRIGWTADLAITNRCCFHLTGPKFDFGWGRPIKATSTDTFYPPGYSIMANDKDSGDVFLMMAVELDGASSLRSDPLLN
eukprot:gene19347-23165_t